MTGPYMHDPAVPDPERDSLSVGGEVEGGTGAVWTCVGGVVLLIVLCLCGCLACAPLL